MGFINNTKDAFLPNHHPWDDNAQNPWDDNAQTYSMPSKPAKKKLQDLSYEDLQSMLDEMTYQNDQIDNTGVGSIMRDTLEDKMRAVIHELKQRDELEGATFQERNESFEQPLPQYYEYENEAVSEPPPSVFMDSEDMDMGDDDLDMFEPNISNELPRPVVHEEIEDEDDDIEDDMFEDEMPQQNNATNFLIGALVVIVLIAITKK